MVNQLQKCCLIEFPKMIEDKGNHRGYLSYIEGNNQIPFDIARIYYLYDVPGGSVRGGHAHKKLQQVIIAIAGSFDVILNDGHDKLVIHLDRAYQGFYISNMIWRELGNFSSGSVSLVLASLRYDEKDYYRDYNQFVQAVRGGA